MLLEQLSVGGVMVIPTGSSGTQVLQRITRTQSGYETENVEAVTFVPFLSGVE